MTVITEIRMTRLFGSLARRATLAVLLLSATAAIATAQSRSTTVILVRHAEKAAQPADDPPLTPAGEARALDLWNAIKDAGVTAVITTQFARTRATAQPTATNAHITPEVVATTGRSHAQDVANAARKHAGQTVLVVGHSNTIPAIVEALGAPKPPAICDPEYDNLYVVTIAPDGKAGLVRAKFGTRTPADASCATMR
jgi:broad specificity phosphatase PhoE